MIYTCIAKQRPPKCKYDSLCCLTCIDIELCIKESIIEKWKITPCKPSIDDEICPYQNVS